MILSNKTEVKEVGGEDGVAAVVVAEDAEQVFKGDAVAEVVLEGP